MTTVVYATDVPINTNVSKMMFACVRILSCLNNKTKLRYVSFHLHNMQLVQ